MTGDIRISRHAVVRFIERVDRRATPAEARAIVPEIVTTGRARPAPGRVTRPRRP